MSPSPTASQFHRLGPNWPHNLQPDHFLGNVARNAIDDVIRSNGDGAGWSRPATWDAAHPGLHDNDGAGNNSCHYMRDVVHPEASANDFGVVMDVRPRQSASFAAALGGLPALHGQVSMETSSAGHRSRREVRRMLDLGQGGLVSSRSLPGQGQLPPPPPEGWGMMFALAAVTNHVRPSISGGFGMPRSGMLGHCDDGEHDVGVSLEPATLRAGQHP